MKRFIALSSVILLTGSLAFADPTTAPAPPVAKVLIVPFKQVGDLNGHAWVGAAIQENLISDVTADSAVQPLSLNQPLANVDSAGAVKAANDSGASIVVFGSYQIAADQLRVTGQATDAASGRVLTSLQVTGPITDLFKIEDTLGSQLNAALPQPPSNLAQVSYGPSASATPPAPTEIAAPVPPPQTYSYAPDTYVYPQTTYVYPSYSYGYPYYYPYYSPFFVFGGFGFHGGHSHGFVGSHGNFGGGHFGGGHFGGGHIGGGRSGGHR
jgi:TolB-like protein